MSDSSSSSSLVVVKPKKVGGIRKKYDTTKSRSYSSSQSLPYEKANTRHNTASQVNVFRSSYKEVSPTAQRMIDQIIDPSQVGSAVRLPAYGVSAIYTAENISECRYSADGRSAIAVAPNLRNAIFATAGATFNQQLANVGAATNPYCRQELMLSPADGEVDIVSPFYWNNQNAVSTFPNAASGRQLYSTSTTNAGSATNFIVVQLDDQHVATQVTVRLNRYDATFALLSTVAATTTTGGLATISFIPVTAVAMRYFSLTVQCGGSVPYLGSCTCYLYDTAGGLAQTLQIGNVAQHWLMQDINGSGSIFDSSEQFVVSAQSLLLTYEGSDLQNGGQLAIARLPAGSWVGLNSGIVCNNWYDYISNLSRNSYNGGTKTGGYCFYLGQDDRSYFYRAISSLTFDEHPYMVAEWTSNGAPTQPVRIMVTTQVQYTTNNNIYDQQPSDYIGDEYCKLLHVLSCINAAYDNPGHRKKLTDALKKIGGNALKVMKKPENWVKAFELASMLMI